LGKKRALQVYTAKNILALVSLCLTPFIGLAPYTVLLIVLALPFFYRQNKLLWEKQVKAETFITAVKTLAVGSFLQVILYLLGILFNLIF
ncbi:MAG TPA: 1,4-dihydroxy-2-naphthoate polyprenyltransferase, partial [Lactobacillus sp.]|nr:1,4-dihydroxy-2-naphthoate polyprenyltransferase [Lactobacillus sp.]